MADNISIKILNFLIKHWLLVLMLIISFSLINWGVDWGIGKNYQPDELAMLRPIVSNFVDVGWDTADFVDTQPMFHVYLLSGVMSFIPGKAAIINSIQLMAQGNPQGFAGFNRLYLIGRYVSILMTLGIVALTYFLARKLYGKKVANIAVVFAGIMPVLIWNGRYFYNDIPALFWIMVTAMLSYYIYKKKAMIWYILAALTASFAIGSKFSAGVVILLIFAAHILSYEEFKWKKILSYIFDKRFLVAIVIFVLLTLFFGSALFEQVDRWILKDKGPGASAAVGTYRVNSLVQSPLFQIGAGLPFMLGVALYIAAIIGVVFLIYRHNKEDLFILIYLIPSVVLITWKLILYFRYMLPAVPFLVIAAAVVIQHFKESDKNWIKYLGIALLVIVILYTAAFTLSTTKRFTTDTREDLVQWAAQNLNGKVAYDIGGTDSVSVRQISSIQSVLFEPSQEWLDSENPDYVLMTTWMGIEFRKSYSLTEENKEMAKFFSDFRSGNLGYRKIKTFKSTYLNKEFYTSLDPAFEAFYISPTIEVFKRERAVIEVFDNESLDISAPSIGPSLPDAERDLGE